MPIELTPRQRELLALVERLGSAESSVIAEAFGTTQERAVYMLRILRKRGLVECSSKGGRRARWSTPENRDLSLAAHEAAYRLEAEKERARKNEWQRRYRANDFERWCSHITRRVVPADQAPRIRIAAPVSVFNLAQCA